MLQISFQLKCKSSIILVHVERPERLKECQAQLSDWKHDLANSKLPNEDSVTQYPEYSKMGKRRVAKLKRVLRLNLLKTTKLSLV